MEEKTKLNEGGTRQEGRGEANGRRGGGGGDRRGVAQEGWSGVRAKMCVCVCVCVCVWLCSTSHVGVEEST